MGTHPIFESDFDCLTELAKYVRFASEMSGLRIEPGSLDLVHNVETNKWSCVLKLSHLGGAAADIAYMIRANASNVLKFKGPTRGLLKSGETAEISVFVLDENKHELTGASALQVTHLQTSEQVDDVKTLFTNEQYLQQAERRKITCAIGAKRPQRKHADENKTDDSMTLRRQLDEITQRLDRQRQMMNILLILSMFQLFIFACTLITARSGETRHQVEL